MAPFLCYSFCIFLFNIIIKDSMNGNDITSYIVQDMNCIFVVISSIMSEEATFLVKPQLTYWTTVDPSIMETFLVKFQVLPGGSSVVTDITAVEGVSVFRLKVFLQLDPLLGPEVTVSDGAGVDLA